MASTLAAPGGRDIRRLAERYPASTTFPSSTDEASSGFAGSTRTV